MRALALAALLFMLSGCAAREAEKAVAYTMKDPDSVKFRNEVVTAGGVCGDINARNSYGAYGGFQSFIFDRHTKSVVFEPNPGPSRLEVVRAARECRADQIMIEVNAANSRLVDTEGDCATAASLRSAFELRAAWTAKKNLLCTKR